MIQIAVVGIAAIGVIAGVFYGGFTLGLKYGWKMAEGTYRGAKARKTPPFKPEPSQPKAYTEVDGKNADEIDAGAGDPLAEEEWDNIDEVAGL